MNPKRMALGFFIGVLVLACAYGFVFVLMSQGKIKGYSKELRNNRAFRSEVIDQTREHLLAKWDIEPSTKEARDYLKNDMLKDMTEEKFAEQMQIEKAQIEVAKAVLRDGLSPKQAKEKYLSKWFKPEELALFPVQFKTEEMIQKAEKNFPQNLDEAIEYSIPSQRKRFDDVKIASKVFPASDITFENFNHARRFRYEIFLLNYAKDNRAAIDPDWNEADLDRLLEIETQWLE